MQEHKAHMYSTILEENCMTMMKQIAFSFLTT